MKIRILIMGLVMTFVAIPGYILTPGFITDQMIKFPGQSVGTPSASSVLEQMGFPSLNTINQLVQYGFIGLEIAGAALILFGAIAKNVPKKKPLKSKAKSEPLEFSEDVIDKPHAIGILQERLAKGEITSNQYQNLRNLLEEDMR